MPWEAPCSNFRLLSLYFTPSWPGWRFLCRTERLDSPPSTAFFYAFYEEDCRFGSDGRFGSVACTGEQAGDRARLKPGETRRSSSDGKILSEGLNVSGDIAPVLRARCPIFLSFGPLTSEASRGEKHRQSRIPVLTAPTHMSRWLIIVSNVHVARRLNTSRPAIRLI